MIDVILTKEVRGKTVSVLLYGVDKENKFSQKYYEVRVSYNDEWDNWYTDSEFYVKRDAVKVHGIVCKEIEAEYQAEIQKRLDLAEAQKAVLRYVA